MRRLRNWGQAILDFNFWVFGVVLGGLFRYEGVYSQLRLEGFLLLAFLLGIVFVLVGTALGLYDRRYLPGSFDEFSRLLTVMLVILLPAALGTIFSANQIGVPRSSSLIAMPIFLVTALGQRALLRVARKRVLASSRPKRALIYGAGGIAEVLIPQLQSDRFRSFEPIAMIDDDLGKSNRIICGIKVVGTLEDLERVSRGFRIEVVIVCIPRADADLLEGIRRRASGLGLQVLVLPTFSEILSRGHEKFELTELGIEDLVGRRAIAIDSSVVGDYLRDKTVMVTGAGGSIGVELCRQVAKYNPKRLIFLDRDDTGLLGAQLSLNDSVLFSGEDAALVDIRDKEEVKRVFWEFKPEVVFHAAALKHLPILEKYPLEAWKTNVVGTANVLEAAYAVGVEKFVNISTDKAADPSSVLGKSKRIAEQLTSWYSSESSAFYHSVRFGNVLGSRGSLVPILKHSIDNGLPITLTHPDATRYFMTIAEACQLVLQAGASQSRNSILILDMGEPVRILEVARRMIEISGRTVEVKFQGLRQGEKLHEELNSHAEKLGCTSHPLIWSVWSPQLHPDELIGGDFSLVPQAN